jgi:uncharacterized short protein YbdD (DUF466 family)
MVFTTVKNLDLTANAWNRYDFLAGYLKKDYDFYVRHFSMEKPNGIAIKYNSITK